MANIQSTQYANPDPGQAPILAQLAAGFLKGGSGQLAMQQEQARQQDEENRKTRAAIAAQWANNGQLKPGTGPNPFSAGGMDFNVVDKPIDATSALSSIKLQAIMSQIAQMQGGQGAPGGMGGGQMSGGGYNPAAAQALFNGGQAQQKSQQPPNPFVKKQTGISEFGIPQYADTANPDYEMWKQDEQPLQGASGTQYSGSIQGINDLRNIVKELGLTEKGFTNPKAKDMIYRANLNIEGTGDNKTWGGNLIPGLNAGYKGEKLVRGGDDGARLGNLFTTLSENILRARTGATAPEPEKVSELARTLLKSYIESPNTWISKLQQQEQFLAGTARSLRPRKWTQDIEDFAKGAGVVGKKESDNSIPSSRPAGATHYSPSTKQFYDDQGNVVQ